MNYYLYKLKFTSPVHFGTSDSALSLYTSGDRFLADTLFSSLCRQALLLSGEEGLNALLGDVENGNLLISDGMIWSGDDFYIPKPYINGTAGSGDVSSKEKKQMKKLRWLPLRSLDSFGASLRGESKFVPNDIPLSFGSEGENTRVAISDGESVPYQVGHFTFNDNSGLYIIAGISDDPSAERFSGLLKAAGLNGIGGKISSGYGKFVIEDEIFLNEPFDEQTEFLYNALKNEESGSYLLITTAIPDEGELRSALDGASYQMTRRAGFIFSETYADTPRKKKTEYYLSSGSVLKNRFSGSLHVVAKNGNHNVYRYSRPLFLGVGL